MLNLHKDMELCAELIMHHDNDVRKIAHDFMELAVSTGIISVEQWIARIDDECLAERERTYMENRLSNTEHLAKGGG